MLRVTITFSGSGAVLVLVLGGSCKSGATPEEMATQEHVQEALQQLQAQGARIAALEMQLQIEQTKATTAEQERIALIQTLVTTLSKGSRKGKGKRDKGQNHMSTLLS